MREFAWEIYKNNKDAIAKDASDLLGDILFGPEGKAQPELRKLRTDVEGLLSTLSDLSTTNPTAIFLRSHLEPRFREVSQKWLPVRRWVDRKVDETEKYVRDELGFEEYGSASRELDAEIRNPLTRFDQRLNTLAKYASASIFKASDHLLVTALDHIARRCAIIDTRRVIEIYGPFIESILADRPFVDWFTLNYDMAVELACRNFRRTGRRAKIQLTTGFSEKGRTRRWRGVWEPKTRPTIRLYKLHGSVSWFSSQRGVEETFEGIGARQRFSLGGPANALMLDPIANKLNYVEPFFTLLSNLKYALRHARGLIVIGYSFRDPVVTSIIKRALEVNSSMRLLLIDPKARELIKGRFPGKSARVTAIAEGFGTPKALHVVKSWLKR